MITNTCKFVLIILMYMFSIVSTSMAQNITSVYLFLKSNPDGSLLAGVGRNGVINIIDTSSQQIVFDLSIDATETLTALDWHPDGAQLGVGSADGIIRIFCTDIKTSPDCTFGEVLASWQAHQLDIADLDWSSDGSRIATSSQDIEQSIRIWDAINYNPNPIIEKGGGDPIDIEWSPNDAYIALADMNGTVGYFDADTLSAYVNLGMNVAGSAIAWNSNGTKLATAYGSIFISQAPINLTIWDITQTPPLAYEVLTEHTDVIRSLSWSYDDTFLASVGLDDQVIIWETNNWTVANRYHSPADGSLSLLSITWVGNTNQIAYGGGSTATPTIHDILASRCTVSK